MSSFGRITTAACVNTVVPDDRCSDPAFALANPTICPPEPKLIIYPSVVLACQFRSIQFRVCYLKDGVETDVTADSIFSTGDPDVALVGAASGNATGVAAGQTLINARYGDLIATADMTVLTDAPGGCDCCDDVSVAMMVLVDHTRSMSQVFGGGYTTKLAFAKAAASRFISEVNQTKDLIGLAQFTAASTEVLSAPITVSVSR